MARWRASAAVALALIVATVTFVRTAPGAAAPPTAAELDALLAPVALYPDQLLAQMLLAAGNPAMIGALAEWRRSQTATGSELQEAAARSGFGDSYAALTLFPDVIDWMAARPDWSARVGSAFAADRAAVFDSVQRLRARAVASGSLKSTPQQQVEKQTTSQGQQVIVIEPANPQVVYVPQYNPQTVYTQPSTTVVVEKHDDDDDAAAVAAGVIGFTAGVAIGAAIDNHYYYGPYGWHGGAYMYNDAWDDWYDAREDARDDWQDHREDMYENRSDRAEDAREARGDRSANAQQQRTERAQNRGAEGAPNASTLTNAAESRGFSRDGGGVDRSGTRSDAFSGYGSGRSERAASERGRRSRSTGSRSSGARRR
jgi:hypothetical protein